MKELQDLAHALLGAGTVKVVIGYEEGPRGVRPAFITDPEQVGRLSLTPHQCRPRPPSRSGLTSTRSKRGS